MQIFLHNLIRKVIISGRKYQSLHALMGHDWTKAEAKTLGEDSKAWSKDGRDLRKEFSSFSAGYMNLGADTLKHCSIIKRDNG